MPPGRQPDPPGKYRIKRQPNGAWLLSGVSQSGRRIRIPGLTFDDAEKTAGEIFGHVPGQTVANNPPGVIAPITGPPLSTSSKGGELDDFGLPMGVSVNTAASVNSAFGVTPAFQSTLAGANATAKPSVVVDTGESEKKVKRAKQAKSLMELAGVSWAAGSVWAGKRMTEASGKDAVNPNPKQVNDLADCTKETFVEWFGDRDIKPWQMMVLLTLGIPLSIFIQSPKKKQKPQAELKSVP